MRQTVETFTQNDLTQLSQLQPEGWSDISPYFRFYINTDFCHPIKIADNNNLMGVGVAIMHEDTAWLAHIIVHPDHRNKGLGALITKSLVAFLQQARYETILLIATKLGEPVYQKAGFEKETEYVSFKQERILDVTDISIPFKNEYTTQVLNLDRRVSGERREKLLQPHLPAAKMMLENNIVRGVYLPSLGEGSIIAESEAAGLQLLGIKLNTLQRTAMPVDNKAAVEFMISNGFAEGFRGSRMRLGKRISNKPESIYSRIGGNLG